MAHKKKTEDRGFRLRSALGETYTELWSQGQAMSLEEAIAYVSNSS